MAIAHDASNAGATGTGTLSWTHTPSGTPRGVWVGIGQNQASGDQVTSVTYGGVAMTRVTMVLGAFAETMTTYAYFLGASIPTGAQTVTVLVGGAANKRAVSSTFTAAQDTEVHTFGTVSNTSATNPSIALTITKDCCVHVVECSGDSAANTITDADYTIIQEEDVVSTSRNFLRKTTNTSTNETVNWTYNADEACGIAVAISESLPPADNTMKGGSAGMYGDLLAQEWF